MVIHNFKNQTGCVVSMAKLETSYLKGRLCPEDYDIFDGTALGGPHWEGSLTCLPWEGSQLELLITYPLFFQSKELTDRHHHGLQAVLTLPSQDLSVLMEEAEASLMG